MDKIKSLEELKTLQRIVFFDRGNPIWYEYYGIHPHCKPHYVFLIEGTSQNAKMVPANSLLTEEYYTNYTMAEVLEYEIQWHTHKIISLKERLSTEKTGT